MMLSASCISSWLGNRSTCFGKAVDTIAMFVLWVGCAIVAYSGALLAVRGVGIVPNYDALSYLSRALEINRALFGRVDDGLTPVIRSLPQALVYLRSSLPFTNTLDIFFVALFWEFGDFHYTVLILHSAYLALFIYLTRHY